MWHESSSNLSTSLGAQLHLTGWENHINGTFGTVGEYDDTDQKPQPGG
jgi:hypothetical protein